MNLIRTGILLLFIAIFGRCEQDVLENYRKDYCGTFEFSTIREDMSRLPPEIIDTIYFRGLVESIYSNREDLILIRFLPNSDLDAVVNSSGYLSMPSRYSTGSIETLEGYYTDGNKRLVFHYRISSGNNYSINHRVEGIRQ
jgi:hypothetical protein